MSKITAALIAALVALAVLAETERRADRARIEALRLQAEALDDDIFHAEWPFSCALPDKDCPWAPVTQVPFYTGPDLP